MTTLMKQLIEELQSVPEEEQDDVAAPLIDNLHARRKSEAEKGEAKLSEPFRVLREANLDLSPDASVTYERDLYSRTADLDD